MTNDLIAEYRQHLIERRRAETTIQGYISILRHMDRELPAGFAAATTDELQAWIYSPERSGTPEHYVTVVRGFSKWATDPRRPRLDFDPTEELPTSSSGTQHPTRAATPDEIDDIFANCANDSHIDLFTLAAFGGFRCVEISRCDREHIGQDQIVIHGKGGKSSVIPTHPLLWARFKDHPGGPLILTRYGGERLSRQGVVNRGAYALARLGYAGRLSMHSLRKFFGTQVYEGSGRDIRVAQSLLRHAWITTTQKYVEVDKSRRVSAVLSLGIGGREAA
jgi:integrase